MSKSIHEYRVDTLLFYISSLAQFKCAESMVGLFIAVYHTSRFGLSAKLLRFSATVWNVFVDPSTHDQVCAMHSSTTPGRQLRRECRPFGIELHESRTQQSPPTSCWVFMLAPSEQRQCLACDHWQQDLLQRLRTESGDTYVL